MAAAVVSGAVARIASALDQLDQAARAIRCEARRLSCSPVAPPPPEPRSDDGTPASDGELRQLARQLYRERRQRDKLCLGDFGEPAWDLMLDLYSTGRTSVTSASIAACVPATTALRWMQLMVREGQLVRTPDPDDGRKVNVELSAIARAGLTTYLRRVLADRRRG